MYSLHYTFLLHSPTPLISKLQHLWPTLSASHFLHVSSSLKRTSEITYRKMVSGMGEQERESMSIRHTRQQEEINCRLNEKALLIPL